MDRISENKKKNIAKKLAGILQNVPLDIVDEIVACAKNFLKKDLSTPEDRRLRKFLGPSMATD